MKNALIINHNAHLAIIVLSFACLTAPAQDYRVLHHFAGGANDGSGPLESLIRSGSFLYGMTLNGGGNNNGVVFRISTVGTDFSLLHSFDGPNGRCPNASLTQSGSTLFGMTWRGGASDNGTIFRINTDGAGFLLLHRFAGGSSDGYGPADSPIPSGSTLFGNTHLGGAGGNGVVYRINTDGTGYQLLHSFGSAGNDGQRPIGSLLQSGSILYGTTVGGGSSSLGTIYKINTNGTGFQLLHSFSGGSNDGKGPDGLLIQSSSTLYGITGSGGSNDLGTIFRINPGGVGFQVIHSFVGGTGDGSQPLKGSLVQSGSTLYGMAYGGGAGNNGVVFQIDTNGNNFKLLHSFTGADGSKPSGSMVLSDSTLYGMTSQGGSNNLGVIFALDLAPKLGISLNDTNVNLAWSTNFPDFALESTDQLAGAWTPVPDVTGYSATRPVNAESQFFRLRKKMGENQERGPLSADTWAAAMTGSHGCPCP